MNDKRKYLFWLIPAALVLLAVLFFLYPRRVDVILHMPASAADIRDVNFQRIEPVYETLEYVCQNYTLTAEREPELLQEICDWLYAARLTTGPCPAACCTIPASCIPCTPGHRTAPRPLPFRSWRMAGPW